MGPIELEVITPAGVAFHDTGLDEVVFRRRERRHDLGSEIAVHPSHGPLLASVCAHRLRYRRGDREGTIDVGAGVAEVLDDTVTLLVQSAERS